MIDFAASALPHATTGISPFAVDSGYEPRTSFDWQAASPPRVLNMERQQAQEWIRHMEQAWDTAKAEMERHRDGRRNTETT